MPDCERNPPAVAVDAYELCGLAGWTVTRLYRTLHPSAHQVDAAHARIVQRSRLQGTLPVDDADVATVIVAAAALEP